MDVYAVASQLQTPLLKILAAIFVIAIIIIFIVKHCESK